jgi:hypothetical protein
MLFSTQNAAISREKLITAVGFQAGLPDFCWYIIAKRGKNIPIDFKIIKRPYNIPYGRKII